MFQDHIVSMEGFRPPHLATITRYQSSDKGGIKVFFYDDVISFLLKPEI